MKRSLLFLILTLSFQSWTMADDIRDFQIEGMSIGDSALDFFSKSEIKKNSRDYYINKKYTPVQNDKISFFETYDAVDFAFLTKDEKYIIQSIVGILYYDKNVKDCYKKMDLITLEMDSIFSDRIKTSKKTFKHKSPKNKSGKSTVTLIKYIFKNGDEVVVACYDYSIEHGSQNHLSVALDNKAYADFLSIAYQ
jgi:hypothetical protein